MTDPRITVRRMPTPPPRHRDPSPDGAPFVPQPAAKPAEPRMTSGRLGDRNVIPVPEGAQLQYRQGGGAWADWGRPGEDIELRFVAPRQVSRET